MQFKENSLAKKFQKWGSDLLKKKQENINKKKKDK